MKRTTPHYANSPLRHLPPGTVSFTRFLSQAGVKESDGVRSVIGGIDGERLEVTKIDDSATRRTVRYLTPEQQRAAYDFWKRHGIRHRAQGSEAAP